MIRFEHVTKRYEDKDALSDLNLEIRDGEIFGLIGHNGLVRPRYFYFDIYH